MPKDTEDHAPEIPLRQTTAALEQLDGRVLLARLVLGPCLSPISARFVVLGMVLVLFPAFGRKQTRKDKDGLDVKFFERAQIRFDALGQGEGKTARRGQQGFARRRVVGELLQVIGCINPQTRVG